jgi:hypothetical protein
VECVLLGLGQLEAGGNIVGDLPSHVSVYGLFLENVTIGPRPPNPDGALVEVSVDLRHVVAEAGRKSKWPASPTSR